MSFSEIFLLSIFGVALLIQLFYYLFFFAKLALHKVIEEETHELPPVSVVMAARDEYHNLIKFLPKILSQDYPDFEVIVVNDSSTDETETLLIELSNKFKNLRYTNIPENEKFKHGKKLAVTVGIKAAANENLLFIDADCYPAGKDWIRLMSTRFSKQKTIVLGYGRYESRKGFLNTLIRYETLFTAIQYFSFAIKGKPYMGVGRNLAYSKSLFFENKGFASHYHIQTGDDDLFINEVADKKNTAVEYSSESHTISLPKESYLGWIKQKQRHLISGSFYKRSTKIKLANELISRVVFYGTLLALCLLSEWIWIILGIYGVVLIIKALVIKLGMNRLDEKYLLLPSLILDSVMPIILALIKFSGLFVSNKQTWK